MQYGIDTSCLEIEMDFQSSLFSFSISSVGLVVLIIAIVRPELLGDLIASLKGWWSKS
jgi:hypothetical protein